MPSGAPFSIPLTRSIAMADISQFADALKSAFLQSNPGRIDLLILYLFQCISIRMFLFNQINFETYIIYMRSSSIETLPCRCD